MEIVRLTPAQAGDYRALMLEAYADSDDAFSSTVADREPLPLEWWVERVSDRPDANERVFGAFVDGRLAGVAGLRFGRRQKTRHRAHLFGMYVRPEHRGHGLARALVEKVIERAREKPGIRVVKLTVTAINRPARRLYESCGFRVFGEEPHALKIGERFVAKLYMWRPLRR